MEQLRNDLSANPPLAGSFNATRGALCVLKFTDGLWYRAKVERIEGKKAHVLYMDYGNKQVVPLSSLSALPAGYQNQPPQAQEYFLACIIPPDDEDWLKDAFTLFCQEVTGKTLLLNAEYRITGQSYVSLLNSEDKTDIARKMIAEGLARLDKRKDRRLSKLVGEYCSAEVEARKNRVGMWVYGDSTPDMATEFGYKK
ncbi:staphylococcal nuclease domain-containing protein 1-like isoform X1 [Halichondria panicea]|uniref:staphylococcal nuclease domain-containing protein 1-like isoform X1 n=1 Tax=Halichondria panicea TaxID=6063 RepID=UPI00312B2D91